ncbi:hypothetical protein A2715_01895 [Candidatus Woesebacteria bacterium RIFCSPHIGHO2_01_FULL_39_32]|uniref:Uncharacterized protein n=2 Tax=Candidatus Woeseibacteriota TaxID=1752722 RepID=A0A0G0PSE4_9BACT|nr:MAG: hypothetical protein UT61_C0001G0017 [Candidatus Woesebacteria bacterium GW2011_GWA1_39_8]OGM03862.1 MAG: hypothetical protein A2124_04510 [Candidatus Woesebacteria bacterium GWB1_37_5]OGM23909.1 MAG: hypothetical protein A2715_01895 [Candidatus Woesebacteria bacterium RIFCSPHIGHO2_01_FULL_39_32]OGM37416.1 MAG: hypothetical protein A3F01_03130 [Candidatus Woesebacteria bacterium RIFCSPHIGHO2_12_FULL_38_11]OGM64098.1 MAG: hypothetical protein A2893_03135 [Candidatus Woesebacteria bacteri
MNKKILNKIKDKFTYSPQNWSKLANLWEYNEPISFYSWECPPRQIREDKKYGRWVNFDVDIKSVVGGKKLDKFTELPRLTSQWRKEKWFSENIIQKNSEATYTKLIANTNGLYLYPKSKKILGEEKIKSLSKKFKKILEKRAKKLLGKNSPKIVLYTELQNIFKVEYEMFFKLVYRYLSNKENAIIPKSIIDYWTDRMISHVGLTKQDEKEKLIILKRVIASYAAEGIIFALLDNTKIMPNPVWVNWEEKPESSQTSEILRKRYGLDSIPVIYFTKY